MTGDWREMAACADGDPEFFYPIGHPLSLAYRQDREAAIDVCMSECQVRAQCAAFAARAESGLPASARFGIFGGMDPLERATADPAVANPRSPHWAKVADLNGGDPCRMSVNHHGAAVRRHEVRGEELCSRCAKFVARRTEREQKWARVDELIEAGHSDEAIAGLTGSDRDAVRRRRELRNVA